MAGKVKTQLVIEGVNTAARAFNEADTQLAGLSAGAKKAGALLAAAFSITAISAFVRESITAADAATKTATAIGTTVEQYTALQYAAELGGVGTSELNSALTKFNRTADEAANGGKTQAEAFERLGVSLTDSAGKLKTSEQLFAEIADIFQRLPAGVEKSALAMELFGRSGAKLIPLLNGGAEGLEQLRKEAEALGLVIGSEQAVQSEAFNDNMTRIGKVSEGAGNQIARELLPSLVQLSALLVDLNKEGTTTSITATLIGGALKVLATTVLTLGNGFGNLGRLIGGAAAAAEAAANGEFKEAFGIMKEVAKDNIEATTETFEQIKDLWSEEGAKVAAAQAVSVTKYAKYIGELKALQAKQISDITTSSKALVAQENKAQKELTKIRADRLKIEQRYQKALAGLGPSGDASYGAANALKVSARQALANGDIATAQTQAQAALKMIQDLAAAGENTYGFEGFIKELQTVELAANDIEQSNAEDKIKSLKEQIASLAAQGDQLKNMPVSVIADDASIEAVRTQIQALATELGNTEIVLPVRVSNPSAEAFTGSQGFARGGRVRGPGTGTSDSIMARLSNGEYVMRAAAVRAYGPGFLDKINGLQLPRFAEGGLVSAAASPASSMPALGSLSLGIGGSNYEVFVSPSVADELRQAAAKRGGTRPTRR